MVGEFDPKARFTQSPVARLATITPDGTPHLVPVVFAVGQDSRDGDEIVYTAVDAKPKKTQRLRRLINIENNPPASLLVDHYTDDWTQLWWVRVDGIAAIHRDGEAFTLPALRASEIPSVPIGSVERSGNRGHGAPLVQLARLTRQASTRASRFWRRMAESTHSNRAVFHPQGNHEERFAAHNSRGEARTPRSITIMLGVIRHWRAARPAYQQT